MPLVSVIMSVYNAQSFLAEAIESILNQSFSDFEFIIINDGSTDQSLEIIEKFVRIDERIHLISRENKGLIYSLNEGISKSIGAYVARMDADDISIITRLEEQVQFLNANLNVGVVSCNFEYFSSSSTSIWPFFFQNNDDLKTLMCFHSPIVHAASMIRKELLNTESYNSNYAHAEDYKLWTELSKKTDFHNIDKVLYRVRQHDSKVSVKFNETQVENSLKTIKQYLEFHQVNVWNEETHRTIITTFFRESNLDMISFLKYINSIEKEFFPKTESKVFDWLKAIFIVHNKNIPRFFIFHLCLKESSVLTYLSTKQKLSIVKRSFKL